ncbi:MAG: hypothetical protein ACI8V8_001749 [Chitinophagales bacterium]
MNSVNDKVKKVSVEEVAALKKFNKRSEYQDLIDSRPTFWKKEVDDFANSSKRKGNDSNKNYAAKRRNEQLQAGKQKLKTPMYSRKWF